MQNHYEMYHKYLMQAIAMFSKRTLIKTSKI